MTIRHHADKLAYFFIAFACYLIVRTIATCAITPALTVLLYLSIAISLLASNIPRVIDIPIHYTYPVRCVEYFTFCIAVLSFALLCFKQIL